MKKLVLVMVCALVMTVFIAFNYVLWDRENKIKNFEDINLTNSASINALAKENKNMEDTNKQLKNDIENLKGSIGQLDSDNGKLKLDKIKLTQNNVQKSAVIAKLLQQADLKPTEAVIRKWAESVDKGQYEEAYGVQLNEATGNETVLSLNEFINIYKASVKSMKIKALKLAADQVIDEENGDIIFNVTLEVKKAENSGKGLYADGLNERYFHIRYNREKDSWIISKISSDR